MRMYISLVNTGLGSDVFPDNHTNAHMTQACQVGTSHIDWQQLRKVDRLNHGKYTATNICTAVPLFRRWREVMDKSGKQGEGASTTKYINNGPRVDDITVSKVLKSQFGGKTTHNA